MRPGHQKSLTHTKKKKSFEPSTINPAHHPNNPVTHPTAPLLPDTKWGTSRGAGGKLPTPLQSAGESILTASAAHLDHGLRGSNGLGAARIAQILSWTSADQELFQLHI